MPYHKARMEGPKPLKNEGDEIEMDMEIDISS